MRFVGLTLAALVVATLAAILWQHARYLDWRRNVIHDRQPLFYGSATFHVLTFVRLAPGSDLIAELRKSRQALEGSEGSRWIYAGKTAFIGRHSTQLGDQGWDGAVLVQYPSREAYERSAADPPFAAAWQGFAATYSHGMKRPAALNLAIPAILLGLRTLDWVQRAPTVDPFDRAEPAVFRERGMDVAERFEDLDAARALSEDAVVVLNLILPGNAEQRKADASYGRKMMGLMAARGHGPAHMGAAVTIEGDAKFEQVVMVFYPGLDYFTSLIQSKFFQGIIGDKQLGDTLAIPTVPILDRL